MRSACRILGVSLAILLVAGGLSAQRVPEANAIPNWSAPATWSPSQASGGIHTMVDVTDAIPYVGIQPCRVADTRGNGFTGQAGPGPLVSFTNRTFQISGIPAGTPAAGCPDNAIPTGADAVSVQFTVVFPSSAGNLVAWQAGATQPLVSVINWDAGTVALGSGTIVPLNSSGALEVRLNTAGAGQTAELVIDINGYFIDTHPGSTFFQYDSFDATRAMFVRNNNTTTGHGIEVISSASADGWYALYGNHNNAAGRHSGVFGDIDTTVADSSGVLGWGPGNNVQAGANLTAAGVRGEDAGIDTGVLGAAETHPAVVAVNAGVSGFLMNNGLTTVAAAGHLGYQSCINIPMVGIICSTRAGHFSGHVLVTGDLTVSGTKSFVEPMASDPLKMINYVSLEGPEAGTYFRGKGRFVRGMARITVPEHFKEVTHPDSLSVQITPIGDMATYAVLRAGLDEILVKASRNVEFYYTVNGVRKAFADHEVIQTNTAFMPETKDSRLPEAMPSEIKRRLVANGLFNADGSVNMETADRLGLTRGWEETARYRESAVPERPDP